MLRKTSRTPSGTRPCKAWRVSAPRSTNCTRKKKSGSSSFQRRWIPAKALLVKREGFLKKVVAAAAATAIGCCPRKEEDQAPGLFSRWSKKDSTTRIRSRKEDFCASKRTNGVFVWSPTWRTTRTIWFQRWRWRCWRKRASASRLIRMGFRTCWSTRPCWKWVRRSWRFEARMRSWGSCWVSEPAVARIKTAVARMAAAGCWLPSNLPFSEFNCFGGSKSFM